MSPLESEADPDEAREERLFRLSEALAEARLLGKPIDAAAWAHAHRIPRDQARRVLRALEWLEEPELAESRADPARPIPTPELPADYEILEELGRGGMGIVYRARQRSLDREVALKVLLPGELLFGDALARFRREAKSLARLRHPHIVTIHEVGEHGGRLFYTMDLIEGAPLARLIRAGELSVARSVRLLRQVAGAIAYVHQRGLLHRDLKPHNVLVDGRGDAFVVDFGLARDEAGHLDSLTGSGRLLGTPAYMAPEQARGERAWIGETTDVYALGAVLYECLGGRPPFAALSLAETIHGVLHQEPPALRKLDPRIPAPLEWIVQRAMAKDPTQRYPTAQALQEDLERFEQGRAVLAEPPSLARRARLWMRRERRVLLAVLATLLVLGGAFQLLVRPRLGPTPDALLRLAQDLERRGEHAAAASLVEPLLAGARGDLVTFRSWVLARLAQQAALAAEGEAERARVVAAEVRAALAERRAALRGESSRHQKPLADAQRLALDVLEARATAATGRVPELPASFRAYPQAADPKRRSPAFPLVWRWVDEDRVAAAPWTRAAPEALRWLAAEVLDELCDPQRATGSTLILALTLLRDHPELRSWLDAAPANRELLLVAAARSGSFLPDELLPAAAVEGAGEALGLSWPELLASLPAERLIELFRTAGGGDFAAELLEWAADLPPGAGGAERAARVLHAPSDQAELLRRLALRELLDAGQSSPSLERWLASRAIVPPGLPTDPLAALASSLQVLDRLHDRSLLLEAFDRAPPAQRGALHLLFGLLDPAPEGPRWPGLGRGAREPQGLADAWHLRWGSPAPASWRVVLARLERPGWRAPLSFGDTRVLVPDANGEVRYEEELRVGDGARRRPGSRAFLDGGPAPFDEAGRDAASLALRARLGWAPGGFAARFAEPGFDPGRAQGLRSGGDGVARELAPGTPGLVARIIEVAGREGWSEREVHFLAQVVPSEESTREWREQDWRAASLAALERAALEQGWSGVRGVPDPVGPHALSPAVGVAAEISLPEAIPALQSLARAHPRGWGERSLVQARMQAGDASVLEELAERYRTFRALDLPRTWLARLWLESSDEELRAAARRETWIPFWLPPQERFAVMDILDERGEEHGIDFWFDRTLRREYEEGLSIGELIFVYSFLSLLALVLAVLIRGSIRWLRRLSASPRRRPRPWRERLVRWTLPTLLLLPVFLPEHYQTLAVAFSGGEYTPTAAPGLTLAVLVISFVFASIAAAATRTRRAWIPAALFLAALAAQLEGSLLGRALATLAYPLGYLCIFLFLFERWLPPGRSTWRHWIWPLYLYASWPILIYLLYGFTLTLEVWDVSAPLLADMRFHAWSQWVELGKVASPLVAPSLWLWACGSRTFSRPRRAPRLATVPAAR